jgi:hypothetical protein
MPHGITRQGRMSPTTARNVFFSRVGSPGGASSTHGDDDDNDVHIYYFLLSDDRSADTISGNSGASEQGIEVR